MILTSRDLQIVRFVADHGFVKTSHVRALIFEENKSDTPAYRRLELLTEWRFLRKVEVPTIGGSKGGSGQNVYALDYQGKKLLNPESYMAPRLADWRHIIAVTDAHVTLWRKRKAERYDIRECVTEPRNWITVSGAELRPDLRVRLYDGVEERELAWWLEVDTGVERSKQLTDKMLRYYHAWQHANESTFDIFPLAVFLVVDGERAAERMQDIQGLIQQGPAEAQELFKVHLLSEFPQVLL
ncbi:replication-relaxation family protein [Streptomyces iakyrus]|uniref:replication-relaxation family protein n=1 Tax=Streptomyces iakyrus TaxID=68219 RepID=UPI0036EEFE47